MVLKENYYQEWDLNPRWQHVQRLNHNKSNALTTRPSWWWGAVETKNERDILMPIHI